MQNFLAFSDRDIYESDLSSLLHPIQNVYDQPESREPESTIPSCIVWTVESGCRVLGLDWLEWRGGRT